MELDTGLSARHCLSLNCCLRFQSSEVVETESSSLKLEQEVKKLNKQNIQ
jgi:hypothetical protein